MPDKKAILNANPVRRVRKQANRTIQQFAGDCGVHYQAVYMAECGVYPVILPKILDYMVSLGENATVLQAEYAKFQSDRRTESRAIFTGEFSLPNPGLDKAPMTKLIEHLGMSKQQFAKVLCVQPALIYRLDKGTWKTLPTQIEEALKDIGFPDDLLEELNERTEEYYEAKS